MKIIAMIICLMMFVSCVSQKNTMKCDAYNGANSKMKYKKWYNKR